MSVRASWAGFEEVLRQLTNAPAEIRDEGLEIVKEETEGAAVEMAQRAKRKSGRLARSVRTSYPSSTVLVGIAQFTAPHAHLQFGTKVRQNRKGANRGAMPDVDVVVPIARRRRERMYRRLKDMLVRRGFQVTET